MSADVFDIGRARLLAALRAVGSRWREHLDDMRVRGVIDDDTYASLATTIEEATPITDAPPEHVMADVPDPEPPPDAQGGKGKRSGKRRSNDDAEPLKGTAVLFPEVTPWPEVVDGVQLLDEITATFARYVILPEGASEALALWVVLSHAAEALDLVPYIEVTSPEKRCGKTRLIEVTRPLVRRGLPTANVTDAALIRIVDSCSPTLLIDEADSFFRDREELRGIANAGFSRATSKILKCVPLPGGGWEPRFFDSFGAKLIAGIGALPDTIRDRAIVITMKRKKSGEHVERYQFARLADALGPTVQQVVRWTADNLAALRAADPAVPESLDDRAQDKWRPLLAIADLAGGRWPELARKVAEKLSGRDAELQDGGESRGALLLSDIRAAFEKTGRAFLASTELAAYLGGLEDRPWPEWSRGKPISTKALASLLRPFGITPSQDGTGAIRGYSRQLLGEAWERYLPPIFIRDLSNVSDPAKNTANPSKIEVSDDPPSDTSENRWNQPKTSVSDTLDGSSREIGGVSAPQEVDYDAWEDARAARGRIPGSTAKTCDSCLLPMPATRPEGTCVSCVLQSRGLLQ